MDDPVFDGVVKDFCAFDQILLDVSTAVEIFVNGVDALCASITDLSNVLVTGISRLRLDSVTVADTTRFREMTHAIARRDAPHSALAKLRRDLDFNVTVPLRKHLQHNETLRDMLDTRNKKLLELQASKRSYESARSRIQYEYSNDIISARTAFESARLNFEDADRPVFEWLMLLESYKGDIFDSLLQTVKMLQHGFFSSSANSLNAILPSRIEFRPLIEMTPEHLDGLVQMEIELTEEDSRQFEGEEEVRENRRGAAGDAEESSLVERAAGHGAPGSSEKFDATRKLVKKWEREMSKAAEDLTVSDATPNVEPDPLSLTLLMSQGFSEGSSRTALRATNNDMQAALDYLLEPPKATKTAFKFDGDDKLPVRMPTTLKWVKKIREKRRNELPKKPPKAGDNGSPKESDPGIQTAELPQKEPQPIKAIDLFDIDDDGHLPEVTVDSHQLLEPDATPDGKDAVPVSSTTIEEFVWLDDEGALIVTAIPDPPPATDTEAILADAFCAPPTETSAATDLL
eukprot:GHVO01022967.1.p1 GENE.GHVO01022967.1~~GHVO01022967.1.p1  ORF type:complete len:559 (-),score=115.50 GHVO01022967.1:769-2316(-)